MIILLCGRESDGRSDSTMNNYWEAAKKDLEAFQKAAQEVRSVRLGTPQAEDTFKRYTFAPNALMLTTQKGFIDWFLVAFGREAEATLDAMRPRGPLLMALSDYQRPEDYQELKGQLDRFEQTIQQFLGQVGPSQCSYGGFKIKDFFRLGPGKLRMLFDAIDFLQAIFKKRGVPDLLQAGVKEVLVRDTDDAGALYNSHSKTIEVGVTMFTEEGPHRMLGTGSWIMGSFMHEFGHHVHMSYIKGEAREFWDSAWQPIQETRDKLDQIKPAELERFYALLERDDFNPAKTARRLKGMDKVKFAYWLRDPGIGEPLITPNQFRLTKRGQQLFEALRNPQLYVKVHYGYTPDEPEFEPTLERVVRHKKKILGLGYSSGLRISPDTVKILRQENPEIEEVLQGLYTQLQIPTEYGKTNEFEDFADTFVLFMVSPEKLPPNALYRMKRTLWLSGFGGKPVSRLAHHVVRRYLYGKTQ
jgi:hypothetical protein